jgi:hypothetical protein
MPDDACDAGLTVVGFRFLVWIDERDIESQENRGLN